jgi:hypothetical protein
MLGRDTYPQDYIDKCRARIDSQLATYDDLLSKVQQTGTKEVIEAFETQFFNNMVFVLDWLFVHRLRKIEGKDGNPLNEVRVLCDSLLLNDGKMSEDKQIKLKAENSILGYEVGDVIKLNRADFARLSEAFFAEIELKFLGQTEPA